MESLTTEEEWILLAIAVLQPEAYAFAIKNEVKSEFGSTLALGTIHTILYRLNKRGFLTSTLGGSNKKRGGRSKRMYSLSATGFSVIQAIQIARNAMWMKISAARIVISP
ncbi:PadR family transcriptional regulator [Fulvivirga sp. M361]|uniref:PadR family transcriptional regulator n=1 Tax=Fulvivirga sp. M361 TaxID=2594266 RepID=UPI001179FCEB|nr:helix-turn-helix transcriptional regulator [Fulvivirga sp. M361]TRX62535.1 PadR family transcriptional regulator [Fulvivirga sp. M361]